MQELEKILEEIEAEHPYKIRGDYDSYSQYNEAWQDAIDRVRVRLENFFKEKENDGWIPVEERLPEDETMMLVTCQTKAGRRSVNRAWYGTGCWHGTGSMSGVIAWMPLPDPYSPERSSNEEE